MTYLFIFLLIIVVISIFGVQKQKKPKTNAKKISFNYKPPTNNYLNNNSATIEFQNVVNSQINRFINLYHIPNTWDDDDSPVCISKRILSYYPITIDTLTAQYFNDLHKKFKSKIGKLFKDDVQSREYEVLFTEKFLTLISLLDWKQKVYLFDVIRSFQYHNLRLGLEKELSWYQTRQLNINEQKTNDILIQRDFLTLSQNLDEGLQFITKDKLVSLLNSVSISVKKSWDKKRVFDEILSNHDAKSIYITKFNSLKIVYLNPTFNSDINHLLKNYEERTVICKALWLNYL